MNNLTTEEKLQHFLNASIEDAQNRSQKMISDYKEALAKIADEHKAETLKKAELQIKVEEDKLQRNRNKEISKQVLHIKRKITKKQAELKDKLFVEVAHMLEEYMSTEDYTKLLVKEIKEAVDIAGESDVTIYIDPADSESLSKLEMMTGASLTISEYSFMGGTRAVIRDRNILIDNSFAKKLEEAKENFNFNGGISHE
ncbi:MAG: V-type ATP synthase subunit E [Lachnospiraceae bacterium]|uniref:V-type ATP synthase subunit E n=1 Tax=Falcatimonas sp. MSJ-15 TaxID=2841515 RepID=UPI002EBF69CF|nr:V-type ATP synthase subunit E [Lachnospiraceae bacterium]